MHAHKTSSGPARLVVEGRDLERLDTYVEVIRPVMDPLNELPNLFIYPGPLPVKNVNYRLKRLGERYNVKVYTPTDVRKSAATAAVERSSNKEKAKQMAHSKVTSEQFYQKVQANKHTVSKLCKN